MMLSLLIFSPLAFALLLLALPGRYARWLTAGAQFAGIALSGAALALFSATGPRFQLLEEHRWMSMLEVYYRVGVDGLSLFFLPATVLLFGGALVASWNGPASLQPEKNTDPRLYCSLLLALEGLTLGIFCALDTMLFFVFWELALIPTYFLLGRWGATDAAPRIAARYVLLMLAGGLPLLAAFLLLAASQATPNFDLIALMARPLPHAMQLAVFLLCLFGFGIKIPLPPLHTWLPQLALAAPGSLTAIIVGLKLGAYGLLRFAIPLAPQAAQELHWLLAGLGTLAVIYGAVGMLAQSNLRVALAYAGISHVGLVVLGLATFSGEGVGGSVVLLLSFSLSAGGAQLFCEFLRQRTGSTDFRSLGGLAGQMPLLTGGFFICGLCSLGLPGTLAFPGELFVLLAVFKTHTGAALGALFGLVVGAAGLLAIFRRAFLGMPQHRIDATPSGCDLRAREWAVLCILALLIFGPGFYPGPLLQVIEPAAAGWAAGFASSP